MLKNLFNYTSCTLKKYIPPTVLIFPVIFFFFTPLSAEGVSKKHNQSSHNLIFNLLQTPPPIPWAKPYLSEKIKILSIAPYYSFIDFLELERRLDCEIELITTEDSTHLGCDPNWNYWCPDDQKSANVLNKVCSNISNDWDVAIIAGISLDLLSREIYELLLNKVKSGKGLILIPFALGKEVYTQALIDLIDTLDGQSEPLTHWLKLFSANNDEMNSIGKEIQPKCINYEKGKIVFFKGYSGNSENHVLIPGIVTQEKSEFVENSWAGFIYLLLWCAHKTPKLRIIDILDAKPKMPEEEDIPPELPIASLQSIFQSSLGPGTYPFSMKLENNDKIKAVDIIVQVRRKDFPWHIQRYRFKEKMNKKDISTINFEIPLGTGSFFIDSWLTHKEQIISYFSKLVTIVSWPNFEAVKTEKNFVYPNDSVRLSVQLSDPPLESSEATIIVQVYDLFPTYELPMGRLVNEQAQYISRRVNELRFQLNVADLQGNYIAIHIWGIPYRTETIGTTSSSLFTFKKLIIPVYRKNVNIQWSNFIVTKKFQEPNQLILNNVWHTYFSSGLYLDKNAITHMNSIEHIYPPVCIQPVDDVSPISTEDHIRLPCFNDTKYCLDLDSSLGKILLEPNMSNPTLFSLGFNNCVSSTEEQLCFCEHCLSLFYDSYSFLETELELNQPLTNIDLNDVRNYLLQKIKAGIPSLLLTQYQKFISECFIQHLSNIRTKIKNKFPQSMVGHHYLLGDEPIRGIDWIGTLRSLDWICIEPDPYLFTLLHSLQSKKNSMFALFDFSDPKQTEQEMLWKLWLSLFNQTSGFFFKNPYGTIHNSTPIKFINADGTLNSYLSNLFYTINKINLGYGEFFANLTPDYDREVGIYYSLENQFLCSTIPFLDYNTSARNFLRIIHGMGINPIFVTKEFLSSDTQLKILILPSVIWLSDEEADLLRKFSKKGTIIADVPPGCITPEVIRGIQQNPTLINPQNIRSFPNKLTGEFQNTSNISEKSEEKKENVNNIKLLNYILSVNLNLISDSDLRNLIETISIELKKQDIKSKIIPDSEWIDGRCFAYENHKYIAWLPSTNFIPISDNISAKKEIHKNEFITEILSGKRYKNIKLDSKNFPLIYSIHTVSPIDYVNIIYPDKVVKGNRFPIKIILDIEKYEKETRKFFFYLTLSSNQSESIPFFSKLLELRNKNSSELSIPIPKNQPKGRYKITLKDFTTSKEKYFPFIVE